MLNRKIKNMNGASRSRTKNINKVSKAGNDRSVDFFSSLPDDVITKIFSLLTMKEALSLCASSRKLKHLRTSIPNVEIRETADGFLTTKRKFDSVSRVLENHDSVVQKLQLSYSVRGYMSDNVLTKIFSFLMMSMREAIHTCVLGRKLKRLTSLIPNVEFKEINEDGSLTAKRKFIESVSRFLKNHDSVIQTFQLSYSPGGYWKIIRPWLSLVVKNGIEEIDLRFDDESYPFIPSSFFTAGTLKVLKLRKCIVYDLSYITSFKSLKSLLLGEMYISNDVMGLLCSNCESLQHLTLEKCSGFKDIEIVNPRSKLETLILDDLSYLTHFRLKIFGLKTLEIHTRKLNFSFIGRPHIDDLVIRRGAALAFTQEESDIMEASIINKLQNVRSLHLAGWAFECFSAYLSMENHQLTKLEVLGLDFDVCLYNQTKLNNLISHAECLKTLLISMKQKISAGEYSIYTDRNFQRVFKNLLDNRYEVKPKVGFRNNTRVRSNTLQNIDIKDFTGTIYEVSYIKFILAHFQHLRVIKVTPMEGMDEEKSHAYAKLFSRFPRVSTDLYMQMGSQEVRKPEEA